MPSLTRPTALLMCTGLLASGCGSAQSTTSELERTTVPGLAAAVMSHLEPDAVRNADGTGNDYEKWQAVTVQVEVGRRTVPLDVMVSEVPKSGRPPRIQEICGGGEKWVLTCRGKTLEDGTTVLHMASLEDPVGGMSNKGFFAYAVHYRDGQMVMVMESLRSREPQLVSLKRLPLELELLEEIATDPLVGTTTSPALNDAGEKIPGMSVG